MINIEKDKKGFGYYLKGWVLLAGFIVASFIVQVHEARAATTVYFDSESQTIYEGDTFIVSVKISAPERAINVVDGTILYDDEKLEVKEISTGGSLFSLWPKLPALSNDKGRLSFVGGAPSGFQGEAKDVFKIIFLAKSEGEVTFDFLDGFSVLLHDGEGTRVNPSFSPFSLNIAQRSSELPPKDEWQDFARKDNTPPEIVEVIISRDPSIFGNNYFVNFFATDEGTGISHYEIKEGARDFVRAESPYLLQDQSLTGAVQVKAIDKVGNETAGIAEVAAVPEAPTVNYLVWVLVLMIVIVLIVAWKRARKR